MVGLVSILAGEILYESIKFVIMLGLLVAAKKAPEKKK